MDKNSNSLIKLFNILILTRIEHHVRKQPLSLCLTSIRVIFVYININDVFIVSLGFT